MSSKEFEFADNPLSRQNSTSTASNHVLGRVVGVGAGERAAEDSEKTMVDDMSHITVMI